MSDIAIRVEGLSKKFHIGARQHDYTTLRDTLADAFVSPFKRMAAVLQGKPTEASEEEIWALRDVSFDVKKGEVVGIIGRNGAGKSTVLKILSRITEPTKGRVYLKGNVGSLLEVGTGFHPELTGRENIYLNGAILGMKRAEINSKFDEIVAFSEIEQFIDTPVKHYSSGMYVRLAFAVAAHMEPEILIVDEVLAVGDVAFQSKCLGKMQNVAKGGRTVLFVSHNMGAITQLCESALWLDGGRLKLTGNPADVVSAYLMAGTASRSTWINPAPPAVEAKVHLRSVRLLSADDQPVELVSFDNHFKVEISYEVGNAVRDLAVIHRVTDSQGNIVWTSWDTDTTEWSGRERATGRYQSVCQVPGNCLKPGRYFLSVGAVIKNWKVLGYHENVLAFDIATIGYRMNPDRLGLITPLLQWQVKRNGDTAIG